MPLICAYLGARRWPSRPDPATPQKLWTVLAVTTSAALFLPIRLIHVPNPDWRLISLLWAMQTVALWLAGFFLLGGKVWVKHFAFPVSLFLLGVPWPSMLERPALEFLTRFSADCTVQIVHWLGVEAQREGSLVFLGELPINFSEACSGFRSLQACLMLALVAGEFHRLCRNARLQLLAAGALFALAGNIARTTALTLAAAHSGQVSTGLHDFLGLAVPLICLSGSWTIGAWLKPHAAAPTTANPPGCSGLPLRPWPGLALLSWILFVELLTFAWYHRPADKPFPNWDVNPAALPTVFQQQPPIPEATRRVLQYDQGLHVRWQEPSGITAELYYFRWFPGRSAAHLATLHTPETCLPATGIQPIFLRQVSHPISTELHLPFALYRIAQRGNHGYLFFCRIADNAHDPMPDPAARVWRQRLSNVFRGRPGQGFRALEVAVWGLPTDAEADAWLRRRLQSLITPSTMACPPL